VFRHLCLAFHHLKLPFHHLKLSFRHHLGEVIKIVPTRGHVLRLKCTKYYFGWGSAPDPAEGDYSACPEPLEGGRPTSKEMGGKEGKRRGEHCGREERRGEERRGEGRGGKGRKGKRREGKEKNVAFHHLLLSNLTTA